MLPERKKERKKTPMRKQKIEMILWGRKSFKRKKVFFIFFKKTKKSILCDKNFCKERRKKRSEKEKKPYEKQNGNDLKRKKHTDWNKMKTIIPIEN